MKYQHLYLIWQIRNSLSIESLSFLTSFDSPTNPIKFEIPLENKFLIYGKTFFPISVSEAKVRYEKMLTEVKSESAEEEKDLALGIWSKFCILLAVSTEYVTEIRYFLESAPDIAEVRRAIINHWVHLVENKIPEEPNFDQLHDLYHLAPPQSRVIERITRLMLSYILKVVEKIDLYELKKMVRRLPFNLLMFKSNDYLQILQIWRRRIISRLHAVRNNVMELRKLLGSTPDEEKYLRAVIEGKILLFQK